MGSKMKGFFSVQVGKGWGVWGVASEKDLAVATDLPWSECFTGVLTQLILKGLYRGDAHLTDAKTEAPLKEATVWPLEGGAPGTLPSVPDDSKVL